MKTAYLYNILSYEATIICKSRKANGNVIHIFPNFLGYGRNETEASMNCIKNFLEFIIEEDVNIPIVMKALKKGSSMIINLSY